MESGEVDECPAQEEVLYMKREMRRCLDAYTEEKHENAALDVNYRRDREVDLVRDEVLELSDKFDFFIANLLRSGLIKPNVQPANGD